MEQKPTTDEILAAARKAKAGLPLVRQPKPEPLELRIDARDSATLHQSLVAFWNALADICNGVPTTEWDVLIGRMSDEGWLSIGPAKCLLPFRFPSTLAETQERIDHFRFVPHAGASVFVLDHAMRLPDDIDDDHAFEMAFAELVQHKVQEFREALNASRLPALLQTVNAYGVFVTVAGDDVHEVNTIPLFGLLPKPPQPRTALEALSRLKHQTGSAIGRNLGLEFAGEDLVGIEFRGASVTDETLTLLDEVELLPEICRDLRWIRLAFTRVTAPKAEALQRRLPHVTLEY